MYVCVHVRVCARLCVGYVVCARGMCVRTWCAFACVCVSGKEEGWTGPCPARAASAEPGALCAGAQQSGGSRGGMGEGEERA